MLKQERVTSNNIHPDRDVTTFGAGNCHTSKAFPQKVVYDQRNIRILTRNKPSFTFYIMQIIQCKYTDH